MHQIDHIPGEEYPEFYDGYIKKSGQANVLEGLVNNFHHTLRYFRSIPSHLWDYRYDKGKWSVKEILLHLVDCERVFAYRTLLIARSDNPNLVHFDQDVFVENSEATKRSPKSLINEFYTLRKSTIVQFQEYDGNNLLRTGTLGGEKISIRALGAIIAGHSEHHLEILKERYFQK